MIELPVAAVVELGKKTREVLETRKEMKENEEELLDVLQLMQGCEKQLGGSLDSAKAAIRALSDRAAIARNGTFVPGAPLFHRQAIEGIVLRTVAAKKLGAAQTVRETTDAIAEAEALGQEMAFWDEKSRGPSQ